MMMIGMMNMMMIGMMNVGIQLVWSEAKDAERGRGQLKTPLHSTSLYFARVSGSEAELCLLLIIGTSCQLSGSYNIKVVAF